jgi:trehalose 6-phosphate synthase
MTGNDELVVLSNRGPFTTSRAADGTLSVKRGAGGLVVALGPGVDRDGALWVAAATSPDEHEAARQGLFDSEGFRVRPVLVDPEDYRAYYDVIANQTIWFCLHGLWDLPRRPRFDRHWWAAWKRFERVNEQFAAAADEAAGDGATVLVQDYQLALVPALLTARRPDLHTAAFVHTPWCSPQELATLPDEAARSLLAGLTGGGACGFHSARWARAFAACCRERLGREPMTFVSPATTDVKDLRSVAASHACDDQLRQLEEVVGDRRLIVRVERIELSKNVLRGFWAYDELLESRPDLLGQVVFAAMVYPSRQGLADYLAYGQEVNALAAKINAKWSRPGGNGQPAWNPILIDRNDNYPGSVAALRRADVLLVNPIRDGLNLIAKEGPLVNERNGVLVLSYQTGAWDELGDHVIGINPFDVSATASALATALDLSPTARSARAQVLRDVIESRSPLDWFDDQRAAARVATG